MKQRNIFDNQTTCASVLGRRATELQQIPVVTNQMGTLPSDQPDFDPPEVVENMTEAESDYAMLALPSWRSNRMCG